MYLRKCKISKAAFFENTSWQPSLYIIWFRVLPKRKYYFMSETYLKPSQTSKMKLLAKVVNASRDIFRTVFSIQNILRNESCQLFLQKAPSLIYCWVLKMLQDSQCLTIFTKKLNLRSYIPQRVNIPLHVFSSANLEINKWN